LFLSNIISTVKRTMKPSGRTLTASGPFHAGRRYAA
jgi:hypothetical protein